MKPLLLSASVVSGLAIAATGVSAGGYVAAESAAPVVQAAPTYDWTGGYVGLQLGYLDGDMDIQFQPPAGPWRGEPQPSGMTGGIYGGYNWQGSTPWVYGLEGEVNWSNADGSAGETINGVPSNYSYAAEINSTAALRLRAGYASGRTLVYAAGGLAYADFDLDYSNGAVLVDSLSDSRTGWTLGVGVEHAFGNGWVGRIDYRYSDFGDETYNIDDGNGPFPADIDLTTGEFRVGVAMRF
jgi:outer membrane immunogenic protein